MTIIIKGIIGDVKKLGSSVGQNYVIIMVTNFLNDQERKVLKEI